MSFMDESRPDGTEEAPEELPDSQPPEDGEPDATETVDWKARYEELRPHADRALSELDLHKKQLDELRNPETAREALERLGYEMPDDDEDEYEDDLTPYEELQKELADLKNWRGSLEEREQAARRQEAEHTYVVSQLGEIEQEHGELPPELANLIGNSALANRDSQGNPDVKGVFEQFQAGFKAEQSRRAKTRRKAATPPAGGPGKEKVNMRDPQERRAAMARAFEEEAANAEE
jgi:hypothetical protein